MGEGGPSNIKEEYNSRITGQTSGDSSDTLIVSKKDIF
jgi:hypothetical protein